MKEYNALLGEKISLEKAKELLQLAIKNEQTYLAEVLRNSIEIARENGIETFEIITPFIEQVNASFLNAIEQLPSYISNEDVQGLNASVSSDDIYNMITNKMIERMKIVTGKGFKKKWDSNRALHIKGFLTPMNFVSGKSYRGVNFFLLKDFDIFKVFDNPYFLTFKQIKELKGKVKKGAKANKIIYFTRLWKIHIKSKEGNIIIDFGTYDHKRFKKYIEDNWHKIEPHTTYSEETLKSTYIPILKYFNVFNGEDVEGIDFKLENLKTGKLEEDSSMQLPKAIVKHYPTPQPKIIHGGDKAAYYFNKDTIQMPHEVAFETIQDYYRVLFHELSHSTGDDRRLNREQSGYRQNQKLYAFEELIAEFGAVFLSAQAGFLWQSDKNHAEYVKHWAMHLKIAEEDNRYIMRAASAAQKSTDYILNLDKNGNPAYLKDLSTEKGEEPSSSKTTHSAKLNKTYIKEKFINDLPDLQTVTNSYQWVSFDPPSRAKREIEDWANWLHEVYNEYSEKAIQENRIDEFHTRFDKYYKRLLKRKKDVIKTRTGTASAAVTGGANFNTNKERAKHDRLHEVEGDYYKYQKYFINKLESVIYEKAGIKSGETDTIIKLEKELEKAQEEHKLNLEVSKAARAYIKNKDKKVLEKFKLPDAVKEKIISDVNRLGYSLHPSSANSSAKIRRIKKRIKAEESRKKKYEDGNKITKFSDFHVIENVDENLLQLIFADKPSEEVRDEIKRHSFRWSRKNSSWQRQLTNNAIFDVKRLIPKLKEIYSAEKGLNAPRHSGKAKEALTECGRLKPGYKYIKGGEIVKVGKTKTTSKRVVINKKSKKRSEAKDQGTLRFKLKDVHLDEKRFQNRAKLNKNVVNNIVNNFKATDFDPLVVWHDPKNKKHYLLAGHHRYEAIKRLKRKTVPVRIANADYPSEKDAIRYARELSNANRTLEQAYERAAIYRKKISEGISKKQLDQEAAIEGRNRSFILNLAHLSSSGKTIQAVMQFADSASVQDKNEVDKVADWIGQARRNNNQLTNAHENEMFEFLTDKNTSKRVTNKAQFLQLITSTTNDMFFKYSNPLNLKRYKYQSVGEKQYDTEVAELREQITEKQKSITDIQDRFTNPANNKYVNANSKDYSRVKKTADKRIASINEEIRSLQRKLQDLYKNKGKYTHAGSNQGALFGLIATAEHEEINTPKESKLPNVRNILDSPAESEFFKIPGAVGEFLQQVEKKPRHSVVITMDGQQGAGKTTTLYRFLDSFASTKKPCVFFSLEEHPESHLARKKAQEYINPENAPYVDAVGEVQSKEELYKIVDNYDFIFIDSWQKLIRAIGNIKLDEDLRMKFDGKVFVIIFQQTTTGRTKGGADIVFDGDIIIKLIKESKFSDNYAYMDKNRYAITDIADILYNVAGDYTYSPNEALGSDSEHNEVKLLYDFEVN